MEDVCTEPCCQTLCYPFFKKVTPNYLHVIVPTGERDDDVEAGTYLFFGEMLYNNREPVFDPSKI
jgi:hypothetical protein